MSIKIISAVALNGIIGKNNKMPWYYKEDLKYFKRMTTGNTILLGRKTFESTGFLPNRRNIVITRKNLEGVQTLSSLESIPEIYNDCFIIGGAEIYKQSLDLGIVDTLYITEINKNFYGDTYFPYWKNFGSLGFVKTEAIPGKDPNLTFCTYKKRLEGDEKCLLGN